MDREAMLGAIDALYAIRTRGETEPMAEHLAEGATFRLAGEGQMAAFGTGDTVDLLTAMRTFNSSIAMRHVNRITALAEGNRCAVLLKATVQFYDREPFETEIFNLWSFDEAGKVASLTEFVDTARLASEVQMLGGSLV